MNTLETLFWWILIKVGRLCGYFSGVVACHCAASNLIVSCRSRGSDPANQIVCLEGGRRRRPLRDLDAGGERSVTCNCAKCLFITLSNSCVRNPLSLEGL
jgi:hypothetical protein